MDQLRRGTDLAVLSGILCEVQEGAPLLRSRASHGTRPASTFSSKLAIIRKLPQDSMPDDATKQFRHFMRHDFMWENSVYEDPQLSPIVNLLQYSSWEWWRSQGQSASKSEKRLISAAYRAYQKWREVIDSVRKPLTRMRHFLTLRWGISEAIFAATGQRFVFRDGFGPSDVRDVEIDMYNLPIPVDLARDRSAITDLQGEHAALEFIEPEQIDLHTDVRTAAKRHASALARVLEAMEGCSWIFQNGEIHPRLFNDIQQFFDVRVLY